MPKKEFTCSGCNKKVLKHLSQLTRTDVVFCTLECRNKNYQKVLPNWRPVNYLGKVEHLCVGCSATFKVSRNSPQKRQFCSISCKAENLPRKPHTAETKSKLSLAAAKQNINYRPNFIYKNNNISIQMRSSWEVKYATWLDSNNIQWEYEPKFLLSSGYVYVPDFRLSDGSVVEIKGYFRPDARLKWEMFCKEYPLIDKQLLMKADLQELKVI